MKKTGITLNLIIRKEYPVIVKEIRVDELDRAKCSNKFLKHIDNMLQSNPEVKVYVKVSNNGDVDYRKKSGDKLEYRIFDISKHEAISHSFFLPEGKKIIF
jgi:hypothetical protein